MTNEITTGVDKLVKIIDDAGGRISVKEAMKKMNVSKEIIEDWANTLEESKTISIEDRLFNRYLVKGVSQKELKKKARELTLKEEAFKQNALVVLKDFKGEAKGLKELEDEFEKLSKTLKEKSKAIDEQLKNLYEFDKLNKTFEQELKDVDTRTNQYVKKIEDSINEKKIEYDNLLSRVAEEKKTIDKKNKELQEFLKKAEQLNKEIAESKRNIDELSKAAKNIDPEIRLLKDRAIKEFTQTQKEAVQRISQKQSKFLKEIMLKRKFMRIGYEESQMIKERLDYFFSRHQQIQKKYDKLRQQRQEILDELGEVIRLAEEYKVLSMKKDVSKEFEEVEKRFKKIQEKRDNFKKELDELRKTVQGKKDILPKKKKRLKQK
ncbi:MAG: hypothetical protein ACOCQX_00935 [Candidatus Nanoarchaeia archaeon]